jgi:hypothetical protein
MRLSSRKFLDTLEEICLDRSQPDFAYHRLHSHALTSLVRFRRQIGIGGDFAVPPLPHHRTYGSVYGGSVILALAGWRFRTPSADDGFTARPVPFGLHPIRTWQAQPKLIGWCMTTPEVGALLPRLLFGPSALVSGSAYPLTPPFGFGVPH